MDEKWAFHFTLYQDGSIDTIFLGSVITIKTNLSSTGYVVIDAKVREIIFLDGASKEYVKKEGVRLVYPWQIVDTLKEAKRLLLAGILYGVGFGSIEVDMTNRPF